MTIYDRLLDTNNPLYSKKGYTFKFGEKELHYYPRFSQIRTDDGEEKSLSPAINTLLYMLAKSPSHRLSRIELQNAIWPKSSGVTDPSASLRQAGVQLQRAFTMSDGISYARKMMISRQSFITLQNVQIISKDIDVVETTSAPPTTSVLNQPATTRPHALECAETNEHGDEAADSPTVTKLPEATAGKNTGSGSHVSRYEAPTPRELLIKRRLDFAGRGNGSQSYGR